MILDEAIEIKEDMLYHRYLHHNDKVEEADRLSIEAMKAWKEHRGTGSLMSKLLLPGETEE